MVIDLRVRILICDLSCINIGCIDLNGRREVREVRGEGPAVDSNVQREGALRDCGEGGSGYLRDRVQGAGVEGQQILRYKEAGEQRREAAAVGVSDNCLERYHRDCFRDYFVEAD